jgi:enamine deaminase RidA (YjgF/YER057c/UK114 family)
MSITADKRRNISSGGPWEGEYGYSRAVAVGDCCWVSGTTDAGPDGRSRNPGNAGAQAREAWAIAIKALREAGFDATDVVRTRTYVTDIADAPTVMAVHGQMFVDVRPAASLVAVAGLIDPTLLVEIEAIAHRAGRRLAATTAGGYVGRPL